MNNVISDTKKPVKIWASDLEPEAEKQVRNMAELPFIFKHVAVMPDAHAGKGSTVGTVIATKGAIIPAAVGVDIGCGMCAVKLPFTMDFLASKTSLKDLRHSIERSVPVGFSAHGEASSRAIDQVLALGKTQMTLDKHTINKTFVQLGTLGGGNHFIEVCQDTHGGAWVVLHSGSRNIGKTLAERHITGAKVLMKRFFIDLPDPDLAYLVSGTPEYDMYVHDLFWAQKYAKANRNEMMLTILRNISYAVYKEDKGPDALTELRVDCHHNYSAIENHFDANVLVTRKGAVSAREGELGIIPGSMGAKSFIVKGKGNPESFCSCSHGAGRKMSRTKAKAMFSVEDLKAQTEGVECRKDKDVIDEIPGAYKDIDLVMANQADLVEVVFELKQVLCIKG